MRERSLELIPHRAEFVDFGQHPLQQRFRGSRRYPGLLQLKDLPALPSELNPHALNLTADEINVRHLPLAKSGRSKRTKTERGGKLNVERITTEMEHGRQ